jgi:preprotein translocase subunit SecF
MEIFKPGIRYEFLKVSKPLFTLSALLVLGSWIAVGTIGLNFGIDFDGGSEAVLEFKEGIKVSELKEAMAGAGLEAPEVVKFGIGEADVGKYFLRTRTVNLLTDVERQTLKASVVKSLGEPLLWDDSAEMGNVIRVKYAESQEHEKIKAAAVSQSSFSADELRVESAAAGSDTDFRIYLPGVKPKVERVLKVKYADSFRRISKFEAVGAAVGRQMRNQGVLSVIYALIGILLYVSFRFDLRYSPGAVLALIHDVSITVGLYCVLGYEFNLPIIAALLAIVGYSLNDTIVVYDRIRESLKLGLGKTMADSINISVSDCLSRTVLTSVTTFIAVFCIWWFGGGIIQNFAFAMLVGVLIGTYSSIYIASPAVLFMDETIKERAEEAKAKALEAGGGA